jgi:NhaP-type Na+/H+ or K+/H+ antiporter
MAITILAVGLLVFVGHFLADVFQRTKVPDVLILMLAGILLGPVLGIITPSDFGKVGAVFTTLALIVILFEGGIHLNVRHLATVAGDTLAVTLSTFALTTLGLAFLADWLLPLDFATAMLLGTILGGTSAAVVVPMMRALGLAPRPGTVLFLESALTDVLVIVFALALMQALAADAGAGQPRTNLILAIARSFLFAGLIGVGGAFVWSALLDRVRRVPNTVFTTFAYVFILFGTAELLNLSGAIAALAFGIAVANLPNIPDRLLGRVFSFRLATFADHERAFFGEVVFLVKTFFFVFLGVSMSFGDWRAVAAGFLLAAAAFVVRAPVVRLLGPADMTRRDGLLMTALIPKGLAAAVMAAVPVQMGLTGGEVVQSTVYATVFFSIVLCAALVFAAERGMLEPFATVWLAKYPAAPRDLKRETQPHLLIQPALAPSDLLAGFQEPNPIVEFAPPAAESRAADGEDRVPRGTPSERHES